MTGCGLRARRQVGWGGWGLKEMACTALPAPDWRLFATDKVEEGDEGGVAHIEPPPPPTPSNSGAYGFNGGNCCPWLNLQLSP